jgi:hypothetical protein
VAAGVEGELLAFPGFAGPDERHLGDFASSSLSPLPSAATSSSARPQRKRRNAIDYGAYTGDSHCKRGLVTYAGRKANFQDTPNSGNNPAKRLKGKEKAEASPELVTFFAEPHEPLAGADTPRSPPIAYTPASSPTAEASHHDVEGDASQTAQTVGRDVESGYTADLEEMMARIGLEVRERREMRNQQYRPYYVERYPKKRANTHHTMSL